MPVQTPPADVPESGTPGAPGAPDFIDDMGPPIEHPGSPTPVAKRQKINSPAKSRAQDVARLSARVEDIAKQVATVQTHLQTLARELAALNADIERDTK